MTHQRPQAVLDLEAQQHQLLVEKLRRITQEFFDEREDAFPGVGAFMATVLVEKHRLPYLRRAQR